jgi:hypothetical protein
MRKPVPLGDQARHVSTALKKCQKELAEPDGLPKSADRFDPRPPSSGPTFNASRASAVTSGEFHRLKSWLNELADKKEHLAYAALLQIWLDAHEIEWPAKVFAPGNDLASRGRGQPRKDVALKTKDGRPVPESDVKKLRARGVSLSDIGAELGFAKSQTPAARRRASDRLRKMLSRAAVSWSALDEVVTELGLKMLGMRTPQEGREIMRDIIRKALGPDYDIPRR